MRVYYFAAAFILGLLSAVSHAELAHAVSPDMRPLTRYPLFAGPPALLSPKPATPPAPLSTDSFDVGFDISATRLMHASAYSLTGMGGNALPLLPSRLQAHTDLPYGFNIGASYGTVPGSDVRLIGAEARYSLIPDSMVLPTIGLRASYSAAKGNNWLEMNTRGVDLSLSKGFSLVTPYVGFGSVWVDSDAYEAMGYARERFHQDKYFVGASFRMYAMNLAVEADRTGDTTHYQARFGWRW